MVALKIQNARSMTIIERAEHDLSDIPCSALSFLKRRQVTTPLHVAERIRRARLNRCSHRRIICLIKRLKLTLSHTCVRARILCRFYVVGSFTRIRGSKAMVSTLRSHVDALLIERSSVVLSSAIDR